MNISNLKTVAELEQFLSGNQPVAYTVAGSKSQAYSIIKQQLVKFGYHQLKRSDKGVVIAFLAKITHYSRQQITRLIKQHRETGHIVHRPKITNGFKKKYTPQDIELLAQIDELHGTLNGAATKKLCERAANVYQQTEYERLAGISIAHLYNLRSSQAYTQQRRVFTKTTAKASNIGERRCPNPQGKPGYIRIDTVHQGDLDGNKGVYHINAVCEVTQFEIVVSVERISENHLIPALEFLLDAFPFNVLGFHSDNGSEYINKRVARLLERLRIEFTKSRPRHSNDNGLAESKNAAVVRKTFGFSHIPQHFAQRINVFNKECLNPYINYHRPCYFADIIIDEKGKQRRKYRYDKMTTPYEKFKALPNASQYLKPRINFKALDAIAMSMTDNAAADKLNRDRRQLFNEIHEQSKITA